MEARREVRFEQDCLLVRRGRGRREASSQWVVFRVVAAWNGQTWSEKPGRMRKAGK